VATNSKVLKAPYRAYDGVNKQIGKFRTEKQAHKFAKKIAEKLIPSGDGYDTVLITHLYRDRNGTGIIYEDEIKSYSYKGEI